MTRGDLLEALAKLDATPACPTHGRKKLVYCTIKFCGAVDCWGCDPEIWTCRCIDRRAFSLLSDEEIEEIRKKVRSSLFGAPGQDCDIRKGCKGSRGHTGPCR